MSPDDQLTTFQFKPDVVFISTSHHDQNWDLSDAGILSERYRERNTRLIRQFPGAKIVTVSSWASNLVNRGDHWWAGPYSRQIRLLHALRADSRVRTLSLLHFTLPLTQRFEPDGIHFLMPFPLSNIICLLEHVVHAMMANPDTA